MGGIHHLPTPGLDDPPDGPAGRRGYRGEPPWECAESRLRIEELQANRIVAHASAGTDGPEWTTGIPERERWTRLLNWHGIDADPLDYRLNRPAVPSRARGGSP